MRKHDDREKSIPEPKSHKKKGVKFIHVFVTLTIVFTLAVCNLYF